MVCAGENNNTIYENKKIKKGSVFVLSTDDINTNLCWFGHFSLVTDVVIKDVKKKKTRKTAWEKYISMAHFSFVLVLRLNRLLKKPGGRGAYDQKRTQEYIIF